MESPIGHNGHACSAHVGCDDLLDRNIEGDRPCGRRLDDRPAFRLIDGSVVAGFGRRTRMACRALGEFAAALLARGSPVLHPTRRPRRDSPVTGPGAGGYPVLADFDFVLATVH